MVNSCIKDRKFFWESKLAYNNLIPIRGRRGITLDYEFFGIAAIEEIPRIISLKTSTLYINGVLLSWENFVHISGININRGNYMILTRAVEILRASLYGEERIQPEVKFLKKFFKKESKGSKCFRDITNLRTERYIPHNIVKFAQTTDSVISEEQSQIINVLWDMNFLDNHTRTFCFKLHNNTLGLNSRVSKFVRGHTSNCTFCNIGEIAEEMKETPLHFFYNCEYSEPVVMYTFREILNENDFVQMTRSDFFGTFKFDNDDKNMVLCLIALWTKMYLWKARSFNTLPVNEQALNYIMEKIKDTYENSKKFRNMVINSELRIRF